VHVELDDHLVRVLRRLKSIKDVAVFDEVCDFFF
jgi:hypothetical protein